jgi:hypothetical protein
MRNRRIGIAGLFEWDGIKAASMPWMTFAQSTTSEQTAACNAIFNNGLVRIIGAAGIEAAMLTQKRADAELVTSQKQQQKFHGSYRRS